VTHDYKNGGEKDHRKNWGTKRRRILAKLEELVTESEGLRNNEIQKMKC